MTTHEAWTTMFDTYGSEIRPFVKISAWIKSQEWSGMFIYEGACILTVCKKQRPGTDMWDIAVHHILSHHTKQGFATRAILSLAIEANHVGWGVHIAYAITEGSQALCRRLIRDYGFSNTPTNVDAVHLLFDEYMDRTMCYSPLDIDKYLRRYYESLGAHCQSPKRKRRRVHY